MPKFEVQVNRTITTTVTLEITARDEAAAESKALDMCKGLKGNALEWEDTDEEYEIEYVSDLD